jgi:hypothetical protein
MHNYVSSTPSELALTVCNARCATLVNFHLVDFVLNSYSNKLIKRFAPSESMKERLQRSHI